ncbi:MAG: DNA-binding protein [Alphaproteobacteria bacterium]|nr:DNA-binding protein [Alphaproteobacteria bacterium]
MANVETLPVDVEKTALTSKELAFRWGVSVKTLSTWRGVGKGPRFFYANPADKSSPRYPIEEVEAYEKDLKTHTE